MAQGQVQETRQEQALKQLQTISQQQLLQSQLVELPLNQFLERINTEMDDNPALEADTHDHDEDMVHEDYGADEDTTGADEDFAASKEREDRQTALDEALSGIGRDDEDLPVYHGSGMATDEEREEIIYGDTVSFYDRLKEQMGETELVK